MMQPDKSPLTFVKRGRRKTEERGEFGDETGRLGDDHSPGFESRPFALAVAEQIRLGQTRHDPELCRQ